MPASRKKRSPHDALPASVGLVKQVRLELKAEIKATQHALEARMSQIDERLSGLDEKNTGLGRGIQGLDEKLCRLEGKVSGLEGKVSGLEGRINGIDVRLGKIDGRLSKIEGRVSSVESTMQEVLASVHRTQTLMEEQRSENRIVLDGLQVVIQRQDRFEEETKSEMKEFRKTLKLLIKSRPAPV